MIMNENETDDTPDNEDAGDASGRSAARKAMRESRRRESRSAMLRRKPLSPAEGEAVPPAILHEKPAEPTPLPAEAVEEREAQEKDFRRERGKKRRRPAEAPSETEGRRREPREPKPPRAYRESTREFEEYEVHTQPDGTSQRVKVTGRPSGRPSPIRRKAREDIHGAGPAIVDLSKTSLWLRTGREGRGPRAADPKVSAEAVRRSLGMDPKVAVILGSGLFPAASLVRGKTVEFAEIPGFITPAVPGHPGILSGGSVDGVPTIFSEGRVHFYECGSMDDTTYPVRTFIEMGVEKIIVTTSAGALNPDYRIGDIMFVQDHVNMMGDNPLFAKNPRTEPSVFVDLSDAYDKAVLDNAESLLRRSRARGYVGVLAATRGPVYETVAERRLLRAAGADAVCMSTIPEVITAAHAGVKVTALAVIVNIAGAGTEPMSHEMVAKAGKRHSVALKRLITNIIAEKW